MKKSQMQFGLKALLVGTTGLGAAIGLTASHYRSEDHARRVLNRIERMGGVRFINHPAPVGLFLEQTSLDDEFVRDIVRAFPRLRKLYASETAITHCAIRHLRNAPQLAVLWIDGTAVGDESLETLAELPALRELCIHESQFTDTERLRKAMPRVTLIVVPLRAKDPTTRPMPPRRTSMKPDET